MDNSKVLLSIIIPVYNAGKYIEKCINSILKQELENIEIIIINDGSTDNTLQICNDFKEKYSNIILVNNSNKGVSYSRNLGVEKARGKYVFFLDADDCLANNSINYMIKEIGSSDIIRFSYSIIDNKNENKVIFENKEYDLENLDKKIQYFKYFFNVQNQNMVWGQLIKRDILENVKFNEKIFFGEDLLFNYELYSKSKNIKYSSENIYHYTQSDTSITKDYNNLKVYKKIKNLISIFEIIIKNEKDEELIKYAKIRFLNEIMPQIMMLAFDKIITKNKLIEQYKTILKHKIFADIFTCKYDYKCKHSLFYRFMKDRKLNLLYMYSKLYQFLKYIKNN